jgi:hypothetical protein
LASRIFEKDSVKMIPILGILYLLLKAFVVAQYSLTTAGALVVAAPLSVLVGTITSYLNLTLLLTAICAAWWLVRHQKGPQASVADDDGKNLDAIAFGVLVTSIIFLPWPFSISYFREELLRAILYVVGCGAAVIALRYVARKASAHNGLGWLEWFAPIGRAIAVFVVLLLIPTLNKPWVPAEVLVLRSSIAIQDSHLEDGKLQRSRYPVVYVLSEGSNWTTVLDAETRILLRLPTDSVAHRQVCRDRDQPPGSVPVWAFISGVRYDSPNTMCHTLVAEHATRLDPLVPPEASE